MKKYVNKAIRVIVGINFIWSIIRPFVTFFKKIEFQRRLVEQKPIQKIRDQAMHWTIDANVSLTDIGVTVFDIISNYYPQSSYPLVASLKESLFSPKTTWDTNRFIISQSGWDPIDFSPRTRLSIRQNQFVYIHDFVPKAFNTLTDRLEMFTQKPEEVFSASKLDVVKGFDVQ
jgi:hypothetical protein